MGHFPKAERHTGRNPPTFEPIWLKAGIVVLEPI
jgi:hypothetical protein